MEGAKGREGKTKKKKKKVEGSGCGINAAHVDHSPFCLCHWPPSKRRPVDKRDCERRRDCNVHLLCNGWRCQVK